MISKEKYEKENYDPRVCNYMSLLIDSLEEQYGTINKSWQLSLDMIADAYQTYLIGFDEVKEHGVNIYDDRGRFSRNPGISLMTVSMGHLQKLIIQFALTPLSQNKLVKLSNLEPSNEDYINDLCGE